MYALCLCVHIDLDLAHCCETWTRWKSQKLNNMNFHWESHSHDIIFHFKAGIVSTGAVAFKMPASMSRELLVQLTFKMPWRPAAPLQFYLIVKTWKASSLVSNKYHHLCLHFCGNVFLPNRLRVVDFFLFMLSQLFLHTLTWHKTCI